MLKKSRSLLGRDFFVYLCGEVSYIGVKCRNILRILSDIYCEYYPQYTALFGFFGFAGDLLMR